MRRTQRSPPATTDRTPQQHCCARAQPGSLGPRRPITVRPIAFGVAAGGNRPGSDELWQDFGAALERLAMAASGTDVAAVAHAFHEVGEAMLDVADELDGRYNLGRGVDNALCDL